MYLYGTQYLFVIGCLTLSGLLTSFVYLPVFHKLRLNSCCEVSYLFTSLDLEVVEFITPSRRRRRKMFERLRRHIIKIHIFKVYLLLIMIFLVLGKKI